ncbi:PAS domain-containing protein [Roseovarius nanhaiticus]|uniref:histidine kinase n=1 Tax=Roseovarius nanhaiticus TaxID=573024 RepID=A0A1N7GZ28_9RHOB|nr:PAS domain-containing protein [Roseovarius nanhaiticus]SEL19032.1 PAS domain S-box-containing protein [Roseovarius nanhaiticus]SIS17877.1 PAS domain S-box-containing protein [Roseovarius nanhaiticus]
MSLDLKDAVSLSHDTIRENDVFAHAIRHSRLPLCITDPTKPDEPIVFANQAFCDLTGYDEADFIGKNCRFLQGEETSRESVQQIRDAMDAREVTMVEIINYRKNGEKFLNALQIGPIYDEDGELIFRFGSQLDISSHREKERKAAELRTAELLHRLKNIVNVMSVVIKMTGRDETDPQEYSEKVIERLVALGQTHFDTLTSERPRALNFDHLARTLLLAYAPLGERQVTFTGPEVELTGDMVTSLTLLLHELATNSVKHGSLGSETGRVELSWNKSDTGDFNMIWRELGGPVVAAPDKESGADIVGKLIAASQGALNFDWQPTGLIVTLNLPMDD